MMNKTGIEYVDYTWNPVTGCYHDCGYCYARRLAETRMNDIYPNGFDYTFWEDRLDEPIGAKPSSILVSSMGDLFGEWVPVKDLVRVLDIASELKKHDFVFLTKNPKRYHEVLSKFFHVDELDHFWLGTSVEIGKNLPRLSRLPSYMNNVASFEPLFGPLHLGTKDGREIWYNADELDWIIVGAKTGPNSEQPEENWVNRLLDFGLRMDIPVFLKDNLDWSVEVRNFPDNYNVPDGEVE